MPETPPDPKQLGYFFALAQVGLEMVVPVGVGLLLDNYLDWRPWGVIGGAILGLFAGLAHLAVLSQRYDKTVSKPRRDPP